MARTESSLDDIVLKAMEGVVARASRSIAKVISRMVAERLEAELRTRASRAAPRGPSRTRPRVEISRWVADRRARRVPNFVIEATGLKTKKAIVAKYGDGVVFEKGKPAPKAR